MKKILSIIFLSLTFSILFTAHIQADFDRSYQDYLYQSDQYRKSLSDYLTSKNKYLTYQTLTAQTEALNNTKTFLQNRDRLVDTYLEMLIQKNPDDNFKKLLSDEVIFYTNHLNLIPAVGSLDDSVKVSTKFSDQYPQTEIVARQTIGNILINKVQGLEDKVSSESGQFSTLIDILKFQGKDVSILERWLLETKNKILLTSTKLTQAQTIANNLNATQQVNDPFSQMQVSILEANQYLKEAVSYLKEIRDELKYGNY